MFCFNKKYSAFWEIMKADTMRYVEHGELSAKWVNGGGKYLVANALLGCEHRLAFTFWFRLLSLAECRGLLRFMARFMYRKYSHKYCMQIPPGTQIGPGMYIGHGFGVVINGKTKIGRNCNISQLLTIGSNHGTPATVGDNVYIAPNVCIVEDVKIGNNVRIGAGTIVIHDVPDGATTVGNPNRIIIH